LHKKPTKAFRISYKLPPLFLFLF